VLLAAAHPLGWAVVKRENRAGLLYQFRDTYHSARPPEHQTQPPHPHVSLLRFDVMFRLFRRGLCDVKTDSDLQIRS